MNTKKKRGKNGTRVYRIWSNMRYRCKPGSDKARYYADRGISVCSRWNKFENFLKDMGEPPTDKHTLDRIDNSGNYELKNCRWATMREQSLNKTGNTRIEFNGETKTLTEWAEQFDLNVTTVCGRLKDKKLSMEEVFSVRPYEICRNGHRRPLPLKPKCVQCKEERQARRRLKYRTDEAHRIKVLQRNRKAKVIRAELNKIVED